MKEILDILRNKENERLKMDIRYWEDKWQYTKFSDKDYKSRIDKAIEYIKEHNIISVNKEYIPNNVIATYDIGLVNILQGEDTNVER